MSSKGDWLLGRLVVKAILQRLHLVVLETLAGVGGPSLMEVSVGKPFKPHWAHRWQWMTNHLAMTTNGARGTSWPLFLVLAWPEVQCIFRWGRIHAAVMVFPESWEVLGWWQKITCDSNWWWEFKDVCTCSCLSLSWCHLINIVLFTGYSAMLVLSRICALLKILAVLWEYPVPPRNALGGKLQPGWAYKYLAPNSLPVYLMVIATNERFSHQICLRLRNWSEIDKSAQTSMYYKSLYVATCILSEIWTVIKNAWETKIPFRKTIWHLSYSPSFLPNLLAPRQELLSHCQHCQFPSAKWFMAEGKVEMIFTSAEVFDVSERSRGRWVDSNGELSAFVKMWSYYSHDALYH